MMAEIIAVPIDDGVTFQVKSISEIMDEAEYPGIRVTMTTLFDGVRTPLKIDISTGDAITPKRCGTASSLCWRTGPSTFGPITWRPCWPKTGDHHHPDHNQHPHERFLRHRHSATTLWQHAGPAVLHDALLATAHKRGTERHLAEAAEVFDECRPARSCRTSGWLIRKILLCVRPWLGYGHGCGPSAVARCEGTYEKAWTLLQGLW